MRVLALEPYYGGSHRAFLDGWIGGSRHDWTLLTLPPFKWKWRMRHGAVTLARQVRKRVEAGESWDAVFCSDMLNLAELRGLAPPPVRDLPAVVYFHENQLTYPVQVEKERDLHFAITNLTTALAADAVWFNSAFHRDEWLDALPVFLRRMPDFQPFGAVERIRDKSAVHWPGIEVPEGRERGSRRDGPLRVLWAARWEFDKDPETFFAALDVLRERRAAFRVSVLGESFRRVPAVFARARKQLADHVDRWGYQQRRQDYLDALGDADVFVSTAIHEFFGLSVVEAIAAGCRPLLPRRLAYPEVLAAVAPGREEEYFYDGSAEHLAAKLDDLANVVAGSADSSDGGVPPAAFDARMAARALDRFSWRRLGPRLDDALERVAAPELASSSGAG
jgi:glycosyltransferase involved in cell wall biosynthesis